MDNNFKYRHLEDQIALIKNELAEKTKEVSRIKSSFFANVSHDIRTPMNAIVGFSNLLSDPEYSQDQKNFFITQINKNSKHLLGIIDNIILTSQIEAENIKLNFQKYTIKEIFEELISQFNRNPKSSHHQLLKVDIGDDSNLKTIIVTDKFYLIRAIINIIEVYSSLAENQCLKIHFKKIQNKAGEFRIGAPTTIKKINKNLHSIRHETDLNFPQDDEENCNLNLNIADKLIRLLGGNLKISSNFNFGSSFYFTIPLLVEKPVKTG
jgi:signal transduction histidine kinase